MKKFFIFCLAALIGLSLVIGPMASTVRAAEKATDTIPWVYKGMYKDVIDHIFDNGFFGWDWSITFVEDDGTMWQLHLLYGVVLVIEPNMPREGVYFATVDNIIGGVGADAFALVEKDGSVVLLSDADIYKRCFHQKIVNFYFKYVSPDEELTN